MRKKTDKIKVNFEVVLFEFIEPLVLMLKKKNSYFVASAMPADNGFVEKYIVVSVLPETLKKYMHEECDLRFLFKYARNRRLFTMLASELENEECTLIAQNGEPEEDWLPDPQFFSSSHTGAYFQSNTSPVTTEVLKIAGNWELEDFGLLSRKFRDLHAFMDSLLTLDDPNAPSGLKKKIQDAYTGKSFIGGFSYVNFFTDLVAVQPRDERFDLNKIYYASPGEIELTGKPDLFENIQEKITNFVSKESEIRENYNNLHKYMSTEKLLDTQGVQLFINENMREKIQFFTVSLLESMGVNSFKQIHDLSDKSAINTAKIALAIYRRLRSASEYFAQGRVAYAE